MYWNTLNTYKKSQHQSFEYFYINLYFYVVLKLDIKLACVHVQRCTLILYHSKVKLVVRDIIEDKIGQKIVVYSSCLIRNKIKIRFQNNLTN